MRALKGLIRLFKALNPQLAAMLEVTSSFAVRNRKGEKKGGAKGNGKTPRTSGLHKHHAPHYAAFLPCSLRASLLLPHSVPNCFLINK